jgi:hypothetical protein
MFTAFYIVCFLYYTLKATGDQYIINFVHRTQDGTVKELRFIVGKTIVVYTFTNHRKQGAIIKVTTEPVNKKPTPNA